MLIGQLLVDLGLITQDQLAHSLELQAHEGGRLGRVIVAQGLCTQEKIDRAWADAVVLPAIGRAVERVVGGNADELGTPAFRITMLSRRTLTEENMLAGCAAAELDLGIEGLTEVSFDGANWVPMQFLFMLRGSTAYLEPESAQTILAFVEEQVRARGARPGMGRQRLTA